MSVQDAICVVKVFRTDGKELQDLRWVRFENTEVLRFATKLCYLLLRNIPLCAFANVPP
jgi:hypothetical protein